MRQRTPGTRVLTHPIPGWVDPAAAFSLFADSPGAVWLDSGPSAGDGWSYLAGASRLVTASVADGSVTAQGERTPGTIFDFLREDLREEGRALPDPAAGVFQLGWVGYLGYELHAQTMGTGLGRRSGHPDAALLFVDRALAFDHATRTVTLVALGDAWAGELAMWRDQVLAQLRDARMPEPPPPAPRSIADWAYTDADYLEKIASCQEAIRRGDAYQLCLTTQASVDTRPDPAATYLRLRATSPAHHGAFLRVGELAILSSSPEQFLLVTPDGLVQTRPIKGTRRRGQTEADDAALRAELESSDKERAENLMIVDLMRNDIGRVSERGTVTVTGLMEVESYAQVHQLVSTVTGRLRPDASGVDAVESCFPAGSMTGAPKHSAILTLDALEQRARGVYSGALGYFGLDGRIDLAMVIRTIVLDERGATVGAGGGITALSVPQEELEEVRIKARALLDVLGAATA